MEKSFIYLKEDYNDLKKFEVGIVDSETEDEYIASFVSTEEKVSVPKNKVEVFDPKETGDNCKKKICNRCNRLLKVSLFQKNQNGKNNRTVRRPSCNDCRKEIDGKGVPSRDKKEWNKIKPNYEIWECPICKKRTIPGITSKVVLDHDHNTGKPRAWICDSCNTGLGRFKDDIKTIENSIKYLKSNF